MPGTLIPMWIEHKATCTLCAWFESWTTREAAEASAVWHVFNDHREVWNERMGTEAPQVKHMPEDFGTKLEPWESQA